MEQTNQYLTFTLDEETFAFEISGVREVVDCTLITKVPRMPAYLRGVINLRGNVISVIDLRLKLNIDSVELGANPCIVIVELGMEEKNLQMGILADSVQEVVHLGSDQIEPAPKFGTKLNPEFIQGIGKQNGNFVIILDIDRVFSHDGLADSNVPESVPGLKSKAG